MVGLRAPPQTVNSVAQHSVPRAGHWVGLDRVVQGELVCKRAYTWTIFKHQEQAFLSTWFLEAFPTPVRPSVPLLRGRPDTTPDRGDNASSDTQGY